MRVIVCIPHYFAAGVGERPLGSTRSDAADRAATVSQALESIVALLSPAVMLATSPNSSTANDVVEPIPHTASGDIFLCVSGDQHLGSTLTTRARIVQGRKSPEEPQMLGYVCRQVLAEHVGRYDLYCFVEDDVAIHDSRFFAKAAAFYAEAGEGYCLLPNRYELFTKAGFYAKAYLDGNVAEHRRIPFPSSPPTIVACNTTFIRARNPFGMCYVITDGQLRDWMKQPDFLQFDPCLSLDIMEIAQIPFGGHRPLYKPAPTAGDIDYLAVRHLPARAATAHTPGPLIMNLLSHR
jgi:hypothetical protein